MNIKIGGREYKLPFKDCPKRGYIYDANDKPFVWVEGFNGENEVEDYVLFCLNSLPELKATLKIIRDCTFDMWAVAVAEKVTGGSSLTDAIKGAVEYENDDAANRIKVL